jgi:hypothetical protein
MIFPGLDNARKTTLLHVLENAGVANLQQPFTLQLRNLQYAIAALQTLTRGSSAGMAALEGLVPEDSGRVLLVDAEDHEHSAESRAELDALLNGGIEESAILCART